MSECRSTSLVLNSISSSPRALYFFFSPTGYNLYYLKENLKPQLWVWAPLFQASFPDERASYSTFSIDFLNSPIPSIDFSSWADTPEVKRIKVKVVFIQRWVFFIWVILIFNEEKYESNKKENLIGVIRFNRV